MDKQAKKEGNVNAFSEEALQRQSDTMRQRSYDNYRKEGKSHDETIKILKKKHDQTDDELSRINIKKSDAETTI